MKVAIYVNTPMFNPEAAVLSAYLRSVGIECRIVVEEEDEAKLRAALARADIDLIALPTETRSHNAVGMGDLGADGLARWICDLTGKKVVLFGKQATVEPERLLKLAPALYALIVGDPEYALRDLARGAERASVAGLRFYDDAGTLVSTGVAGKVDLAEMPIPDLDPFYDRPGGDSMGYFLTVSRGCPYTCSFCQLGAVTSALGEKRRPPRYYPVAWAIGTLERIRDKYGPINTFYLTDTNFTLQKSWLREFLAEYKRRIGVPFVVATRPNLIDDEVSAMLADAGCSKVNLGIETGIEDLRNDLLNKNLSDHQIAQAVDSLNRHGLRAFANMIIGLPGDDLGRAVESLDRIARLPISGFNVALFQPLAGTKLAEYALEHGYVGETELAGKQSRFDGKLNLDLPDRQAIENLALLAPLLLVLRWPRLVKLLCRLPKNRLFYLVSGLPKVMRSLKYEYKDRGVPSRLAYLLRSMHRILVLRERPLIR